MLLPTFEQKKLTARVWQGYKQRPNQFGDNKNVPQTDYQSHIGTQHQKDYVAPLLIEESDNIPCDDSEKFGGN